MLSRRHAHVRKPSLYSMIWAPPHERVHNGLVPAPRPLSVLIPGSHRVPPLVSTRRKVLSVWRCHIAPAKPNGPIPFDLNDKRCNLTSQIVFFYLSPGPYRYILGLYRVLHGLVPNSPSSYSSSLSFSPCPHRVLTVCIPPPLKYVMLL